MSTHLLRGILSVMVLTIPTLTLAQQQSAVIRGIVTGADGQPVAAAEVTLLDHLGARVETTTTDVSGQFRLDEVPPGSYTLLAEAPSQRSDARLLAVQAASKIDIELTLAPRVAESVFVQGSGEAPPVTTRITVAGEALRQLPARVPSRAVEQLLATLPGWASEDNGLLHVRGVDDGFLYVEDGVPVYDRVDTLFGIPPDSANIGSLNVLTGYIPPEYGLKSGAVIEVQSSTTGRSEWTGAVDGSVGSDGLRAVQALGGGPVRPNVGVGLSVTSERSDRFLDPVDPDNLHNTGSALSGAAHASIVPSGGDLVRVNIAAGRSRYDVPHGEVQDVAGQDQRQRLAQDSESGSWQHVWSDVVVSQLAIFRRHTDAELRGSPLDVPLSASSVRDYDRVGILASASHARERHTLKFGFELAQLALHEDFSFAVTDPEIGRDADISDRAEEFTVENPFRFRGRVRRDQWALYLQDRIRANERLTVDFGVRFDRTHLLIPASQWSPRVGVAYTWPQRRTTVRASVNRFFQPPQPEHLLLSSSPAARELSPFVGDSDGENAGGADLSPERQTAWELAVDQWFAGVMRFDAAFWSRHVRNYADPNVFFGTTIVFPNSVASGTARGLDLRFEMARYHGWSSYISYTLSKVEQVGPINGGLFLEESGRDIGVGTRFTPDHDQRHVGAAGLSYQSLKGFSASLAVRYQSGTPVEIEGHDTADLRARRGAELVDFERGRVRPRTVLDLTASEVLLRRHATTTSLRIAILNLANRAYAINFGNPFSGTHFGAPRTLRVDLRVAFR